MNFAYRLGQRATHNTILRKWALKIYRIKYPPPYRRPNMEFDFDLWSAMSTLRCYNGHQIGEDNAGPYLYRENIRNEYETCKFRDSREGLPMNVSTLRFLMPVWGDALQLTTLLREKYRAHRHLGSDRFNLVQAYLFSKFAVCLPAYLTRRKEKRIRDGELQSLETVFFMLGTTPFMLAHKLMVSGDSIPLDPKPMDAQHLYDLANTSGTLISSSSSGNKACPASPKLIQEFLDVMMNGSFSKPLDSTEAQRVLSLVGNWNQFYNYAYATSRLELLIKLNQALTARALLTLLLSENAMKVSEQSVIQTVLQTTLNRSYVKAASHNNAYTIIVNVINILSHLLRDHDDYMTLDKLDTTGCFEAVAQVNTSCRDIALRIRVGNAIIYQACRRDLLAVHQALGRSNWGCITEFDLLRRTGGPKLRTLLDSMESNGIRIYEVRP